MDTESVELRVKKPRTPKRDSILEVMEVMAKERNQSLASFALEVLSFHPYLVHRLQEARGEFKMQRAPRQKRPKADL